MDKPKPIEQKPLTARPLGQTFMVETRGVESRTAQRADGRVVETTLISDGEGCYRRMPTCRGFGYVDLVIVLAIIAGVGVMCAWFYGAGKQATQAEWDKDKAAKASAALKQQEAISDAVKEGEAVRALAVQKAEFNEAKWEEAERARRRNGIELASCEESRQAQGPGAPAGGVVGEPAAPNSGAPGVPGSGARVVALRWRFVGMHDGAFTGTDGGPVFVDSERYALDASRADTPSPYGLDDALEVGKSNAVALSTCRREFFALRGRVEAARTAIRGQP